MLWDSNIIIYSSLPEYAFLQQLSEDQEVHVSTISHLEVLGYHSLIESGQAYFERFFQAATTIDVNSIIINQAVTLRQQKKMSLGDAIIAATALEHQLTLLSRNVTDFQYIIKLEAVDPFKELEE